MASANETDFNYYFKQDISRLFKAFTDNNFFSFAEFVQLWNEMKFYQIFGLSRFFPVEYREFMKDSLKIVAEFFYDDDYNLEVRTAALYTLYAFYTQQINKPTNKVPVTPDQWIKILNYVAIINERGHQDIEYVFRYLLHSNAFEFCSDQEFENFYNLKTVKGSKKPSKAQEKDLKKEQDDQMESFKDDVFNDILLQQMKAIHEAYFEMRDEISRQAHGKDQISTYSISNFDELIDAAKLIDDPQNAEGSGKSKAKDSVFKKLASGYESTKMADLLAEAKKNRKPAPKNKKPPQKSTQRISRNLDSLINIDIQLDDTTDNESTSAAAKETDGEAETEPNDDESSDGSLIENEDDDSVAEDLMDILTMTQSSNDLATQK